MFGNNNDVKKEDNHKEANYLLQFLSEISAMIKNAYVVFSNVFIRKYFL